MWHAIVRHSQGTEEFEVEAHTEFAAKANARTKFRETFGRRFFIRTVEVEFLHDSGRKRA
jgi:hypothetical protein